MKKNPKQRQKNKENDFRYLEERMHILEDVLEKLRISAKENFGEEVTSKIEADILKEWKKKNLKF